MDQSMNEKLTRFSNLVLSDAEHQKEELHESIISEKTERLAKKEDEFLTKAYAEIQADIEQVQKEDNARVLHEEVEAKRKILLKREEIIDKVFALVKDKLAAFKMSDDYLKWLLKNTQKALDEVGKGSKVIYVSSEDMCYKKEIEELGAETGFKVTVTQTDEKDFLGGVKVFNPDRKVTVNYSIGELLNEQKSEFLQTSGLSIE